MRFEFDAAKSNANLAKHGIDFEMAQELWRDVEGLVVPSRAFERAKETACCATTGQIVDCDFHGTWRSDSDHQCPAIAGQRTHCIL